MQTINAKVKHISENIIDNALLTQIKFENKIKNYQRKDNGIFFTNSHKVIETIIDIIDIDNCIYEKKILEPACGHGIYLMILLAKIYEKQPNPELLKSFIKNNIIFCDIQTEMVEFAKNNLSNLYKSLTNTEYNETFNGFVVDFTKKEITNSLFNNCETILSKYYSQIDYVIGNPPYISYYGRRDRKQSEQQRIDYLINYKQFPDFVKNGKINSVMLFIEHSLDFLKANGKLCFIIDIAFFEMAYLYTRKYLLENTKINSLFVNIKDFDVASGQIIIKLTKTKQNKDNQVQIIDYEKNSQFIVNQQEWNNLNDEYKFRFNGSGISKLILDKIRIKKEPIILQLYPSKNLRTCVMLLDMEYKFTYASKNGFNEDLIYPYYQGSKSLNQKYGKLSFTKYFYYNKPLQDEINDKLKIELEAQGVKNKKRIGLGETIIYDNPKIYIRQSAKEIIATLDLVKSSANNSLYSFTLRDNSEKTLQTLKFICGILNSKLITYFAQQLNIIRFTAGKQPQIKISDLGQVPLLQDIEIQNKIVSIVDLIYYSNSFELTNEIDKIIFEHYKLTNTEIQHIEKAIKDF
jgi:tRNA1(Val) A37 N6-methylase TrmN6